MKGARASRGSAASARPIFGLFGDDVLAAASPIGDGDDDLLPEERALVAGAGAARRLEFATGRRLARVLLARLGAPAGALLRGAERAPSWPPGIVGSISHKRSLCAVAVARGGALLGLGVDVEEDAPLAPALWRRVCTAAELDRLRGAPPEEAGRTARWIFCAKEATYKCVHPGLHASIGFQDVEVALDLARGRFEPRLGPALHARLPLDARLEGSLAAEEGWLFAGAVLRR